MKKAVTYSFQILILLVSAFLQNPVFAQSATVLMSTESEFNLKKARLDILSQLRSLTAEQQQLRAEVMTYVEAEDYDTASILVDELIEQLLNNDPIERIEDEFRPNANPAPGSFVFTLNTGVDFNRQEFELGYSQSDSLVLEEISRPYIGVSGEYKSGQWLLQNSIRFDNENIRDDWQARYSSKNGNWYGYNGYWNSDLSTDETSYHEHDLVARVKLWESKNKSLEWNESFSFKDYLNENSTFNDYYRNHSEITFRPAQNIRIAWLSELNEALGVANNDYLHNGIRAGLSRTSLSAISYLLEVNGAIRNYKIQIEDSTIANRYNQIDINAELEIPVSQNWFVGLENQFSVKNYQDPSPLEPEYRWNLSRPTVRLRFNANTDIRLGYEHEFKKHTLIISDAGNTDEQDYSANGVFLSANYFNFNGTFISADLSYQWRRYPFSATNNLLSLYSDRNIFTVFVAANLPFNDTWSLNIFATYDNDNDIDQDQQNSQSSIFTAELQYRF